MSEQIQETIIANNNNEFYLPSEVDHMIANNSYHPMIQLPFPPTIEPKDLIVNKKFPQPNGKQSRAPNAFIIYRKAFVKAAREQGYILPMTAISSMASASWEKESIIVKEEYKRIAKDAHKLVKEMFPKKSNQRKRKEKWNLVSFQDKSLNNNNNNNNTNLSKNNSSEQKSTEIITPILNSTSSSPNLSEFDGNFSEKSFTLQQQSANNNADEVQISNNYLIDTNLPNSFQEYLYSNFYDYHDYYYQNEDNFFLTNWLNQSENYTLDELELLDTTTSVDDLKNNSQSTLNMTLVEAMGIINSEGFDLGFDHLINN